MPNEVQNINKINNDVVLSQDDIQRKIYTIRGVQVMLDRDLAPLYQVETKNLNKAVKRNIARFPDDFMFQLANEEVDSLRFHFGTSKDEVQTLMFQNGTSKKGRGGTRYLPYAFTEEGVSQLAGVLHSDTAIQVSIRITRAFVAMRKFINQTTLHTFECSHDRWLIIDDTVYHFGASIKDLGKKWFSVDIITEQTAEELISRLS